MGMFSGRGGLLSGRGGGGGDIVRSPIITGYDSGAKTVSGTAQAGATVRVFKDQVEVGTSVANGAGLWSYVFGTAPATGSVLGAKQTVGVTSGYSNLLAIVPPPILLGTLSLSATSFPRDAPAGTVIGSIVGKTAGSTVSIEPADGRVALSGGDVVIGLTPSEPGSFSITLREVLAGAANTPRDTVISLTAGASMKRATPASSDIIYIGQPHAASGKFMSYKLVKNVDGSNDAGTAHDPWRLGMQYVTDAIDDNPTAINFTPISGNVGARDYALKSISSSHGGSYHGGEANNGTLRAWHGTYAGQTSPLMLADGAAWTPGSATSAQKFEIRQSSTITWTAFPGQTATVDSRITIEEDNTTVLEHRLEGNFTGPTGVSALNFPTLAYADPRYSRLIFGSTTVDMSGNGTEYDLPGGTASIRLLDPRTGDYVEMSWIADRTIGRMYVLYNTNNSKLYISDPAGAAMGVWTVTQKVKHFIGAIAAPALPLTDTFAGSALSAWWRLAYTTGAPNSVVSGGEWVITSNANANRWTHPICDAKSPGTYHVEIDYQTSGASGTAVQVLVMRHDSGSNSTPLATYNLNSTAGTTLSFDIVVAAGQSPCLLFLSGVSGRIATIREMRITKTA